MLRDPARRSPPHHRLAALTAAGLIGSGLCFLIPAAAAGPGASSGIAAGGSGMGGGSGIAAGGAGMGGGSGMGGAPRAADHTESVSDFFTPQEMERARQYRGPRLRLDLAALAVGLAVLIVLGLGPGTRALGSWTGTLTGGRWWLQGAVLAAAVVLAGAAIRLPFSTARFFHDRSFGLTPQPFVGRLVDFGKAAGVEVALSVLAAVVFLAAVRAFPRWWPAVVAAGAAALTVALVVASPLIFEPLFSRFEPVDPATEERILRLADRAGVRVGEVLVADASRRTTRLNAYVSGIGPTKRVVLYDTLLERAPPEEVGLVVAHELAHVAHRDVLRGTLLGAGGAALGVLALWALLAWQGLLGTLGATGPGDPRVIPFIVLFAAAATLLTLPIQNAVSRSMEAGADRAALEYTQDPETSIALTVRLARENIADLQPNRALRWVFATHPSTMERIRIAREWQQAHPDAGGP